MLVSKALNPLQTILMQNGLLLCLRVVVTEANLSQVDRQKIPISIVTQYSLPVSHACIVYLILSFFLTWYHLQMSIQSLIREPNSYWFFQPFHYAELVNSGKIVIISSTFNMYTMHWKQMLKNDLSTIQKCSTMNQRWENTLKFFVSCSTNW